ncbi:MAG: hypothetical protein WD200_00770 [Candidatus Andersenbacteria bacterium]
MPHTNGLWLETTASIVARPPSFQPAPDSGEPGNLAFVPHLFLLVVALLAYLRYRRARYRRWRQQVLMYKVRLEILRGALDILEEMKGRVSDELAASSPRLLQEYNHLREEAVRVLGPACEQYLPEALPLPV